MKKEFSRPLVSMKGTGRNIKALRLKKGISVKEMQDLFGFDYPQTIYNWESGKNLPSIDNLIILADFFQVPLDEIVAVSFLEDVS
ncbi:MAG: helix-turn-helix transcriptional regulator [Spirochaetales bacterium]|nr:helix-turn-helix transcriptional regulator [Candidatus Physcosoma equi]